VPALYRQNVFVPPGASQAPVPKPTLRKVKLAAGIAQIVTLTATIGGFVAGGVLGPDTDAGGAFMILGGISAAFLYMSLFAYSIVNLVSAYKFWSWIPPEQRHTNLWKKYISPGAAVGFMFIPYFNIFWMFVIYLGIADILERMRVAYPTDRESAKNRALMMLIVPMIFFPAGPFLHYFFDKHVEAMANDMQARMPAPSATPYGY